ncbi:MAG: hypothetical protein ACC742_16125 [Thermoanaerobaculales bacterium]
MKVLSWILEFTLVFALAFVVTAAVSFLWSLVAHGAGVVDWASAVRFGITLGILLPWMNSRAR